MKSSKSQRKKTLSGGERRRKVLPLVFGLLSLLLMVLPLESPVASVKALLSYIFVPQIRASHGALEYAQGVSSSIRELLDAHHQNGLLREELGRLRLENAQAHAVMEENKRLTSALGLRAPRTWRGVWTKTAYREPTQWNSVVVDKGTLDGVYERAAAVAQKDGKPILAGVVVEAGDHTAKVLLLRDEDFSAAVYAVPSGEEGLLSGAGAAQLKMNYLPLLSDLKKGEKVYTSSSSSLFPSGILVGEVSEVEEESTSRMARSARVEPAIDAASVRELFILSQEKSGEK